MHAQSFKQRTWAQQARVTERQIAPGAFASFRAIKESEDPNQGEEKIAKQFVQAIRQKRAQFRRAIIQAWFKAFGPFTGRAVIFTVECGGFVYIGTKYIQIAHGKGVAITTGQIAQVKEYIASSHAQPIAFSATEDNGQGFAVAQHGAHTGVAAAAGPICIGVAITHSIWNAGIGIRHAMIQAHKEFTVRVQTIQKQWEHQMNFGWSNNPDGADFHMGFTHKESTTTTVAPAQHTGHEHGAHTGHFSTQANLLHSIIQDRPRP